MNNKSLIPKLVITTIILAALVIIVYLYLQNRSQNETIARLTKQIDNYQTDHTATIAAFITERETASSTIAELSSRLSLTSEELKEIEDELEREKDRNEDFEKQIKKISGTVGVLDKLSKTDKELLQKYSKVYFLNENYIPERLKQIDTEYVLIGKKDQYFHAEAVDHLTDMIEDAKEDGIDLKIVSAYRSFDEQMAVKDQYSQIYGSGANTFSADQGYSEHQLGTTVDLTVTEVGGAYTSFAKTPAYSWLLEHAHRYGFALSYPENNSYYIFEPWHWRFIGIDLARDLHRQEAFFYDWDQRKIDEYLVSIFD